jgi:hypothetical protein
MLRFLCLNRVTEKRDATSYIASDAFLERATLQLVRCRREVAAVAMDQSHKIIISGTGRAGTTFLVQLLTELGLDTGYAPGRMNEHIDENSHGGLEHNLPGQQGRTTLRSFWRQPKHTLRDMFTDARPTPYIVKNPEFCDTLAPVLAEGHLTIDHAFIPIRDLDAAALSRMHVGGASGSVSGGLWKTEDPGQQKAVLAEMFFNLIHTLTVYDVPHTFLLFPRLVQDWEYTYRKLWFLTKDIAAGVFQETFERAANPELVHNFSCGTASGADRTEGRSSRPARQIRSGGPVMA